MSALQSRATQQILNHAIANRLAIGHHITQASVQQLCGTSRAPVRAALQQLRDLGVVQLNPNKGFTLLKEGKALEAALQSLHPDDDETAYQEIASERTAGKLFAIVSETELMRRFDLSRSRLRRVLDRIAREGWIERRPGNGWRFLPLIDSARAYAESFEIRQALEPAGILSIFFQPDREILKALLDRQNAILQGFFNASEVFEANAELHEQIARMSNNRFLVQIIAHQNHLRRLLEYKLSVDTERARRMCEEHIEFLDFLLNDDRQNAAESLARHLDDARRAKMALLDTGQSSNAN